GVVQLEVAVRELSPCDVELEALCNVGLVCPQLGQSRHGGGPVHQEGGAGPAEGGLDRGEEDREEDVVVAGVARWQIEATRLGPLAKQRRVVVQWQLDPCAGS